MFKFKTEDGLDYMVPDLLHKCQINFLKGSQVIEWEHEKLVLYGK
jgi:hypothetical protein